MAGSRRGFQAPHFTRGGRGRGKNIRRALQEEMKQEVWSPDGWLGEGFRGVWRKRRWTANLFYFLFIGYLPRHRPVTSGAFVRVKPAAVTRSPKVSVVSSIKVYS